MKQEKLKEILKSQREEYQRYLGVLAENFGSQFKLINDLTEKISREEFKIIEKRIDLLEKRFQKA